MLSLWMSISIVDIFGEIFLSNTIVIQKKPTEKAADLTNAAT